MKLLVYEDLKSLEGMLPYSKAQIWRMEKRKQFPKRAPLGSGRHGWADDEIDAWIASRIRQRNSSPAIACGVPVCELHCGSSSDILQNVESKS